MVSRYHFCAFSANIVENLQFANIYSFDPSSSFRGMQCNLTLLGELLRPRNIVHPSCKSANFQPFFFFFLPYISVTNFMTNEQRLPPKKVLILIGCANSICIKVQPLHCCGSILPCNAMSSLTFFHPPGGLLIQSAELRQPEA